MTFPWGLTNVIQSVGSLKHTWSKKVMSDAISAYVRGSTFLAAIPPDPIATVTWFQTWDSAGNGACFCTVFHSTYAERCLVLLEVDSVQYLIQPDNEGQDEQVFRIQITDEPELLSIATTPKPVSLPLAFESTELTLPMCGPGADSKHGDMKMTWKANNVRNLFNFVDFAGGSTLYQEVNMTGVLWINGTSREIAGGIGLVEVYHR
jgi:hypothetical protein